jgi:16S rRNA (adenine1518-N6/adenine1519-N6)-dimethyltransferase
VKLSEMRQLLTEHDLRLTKSLGQNFLHDGNQLRRIVDAAELSPTDKVLEIGPGLGPLTELLIERAGEVLAIEKDARLVEILRQRFPKSARLELIHDDALDLFQREPRDWSGWKLVANLPYSVASPILVELAQPGRCPERMVVTLQLEVAKRILAGPGSPDYGVLTLLLQLHYEPAGMFKIPAGCFFPPPDVDSACITLKRRPRPGLTSAECAVFVRVVKRAFSQRRKMMLKLLKEEWDQETVQAACQAAALEPSVRAEAVPLERFCTLSQRLAGS